MTTTALTDLYEISSLIHQAGAQRFKPAVLPKDIARGKVGECFDWCIVQAICHPKYTYVEGLAREPGNDRWILHAWLTDGEHAFDPTWGAFDNSGRELPMPSEYLGLTMDTKLVVSFMKRTGYQGVLANRDRAPSIFNKLMEVRP